MPESAISLLHLKTSSTWMSVSWGVLGSALGGVPVTTARVPGSALSGMPITTARVTDSGRCRTLVSEKAKGHWHCGLVWSLVWSVLVHTYHERSLTDSGWGK